MTTTSSDDDIGAFSRRLERGRVACRYTARFSLTLSTSPVGASGGAVGAGTAGATAGRLTRQRQFPAEVGPYFAVIRSITREMSTTVRS